MTDDYTPTMAQWRDSFQRFLVRNDIFDPEDLVEELDRVLTRHTDDVLEQAASTLETDEAADGGNNAVLNRYKAARWIRKYSARIAVPEENQ